MKRNKLLFETSKGVLPIQDDTVQILFDNCPDKTPQEVGTKMMLAMCLYGFEAAITQDLARRAAELAEEFVG